MAYLNSKIVPKFNTFKYKFLSKIGYIFKITKPYLAYQNSLIPNNYLWDGFWINDFKNGELNVSASFDKSYYRDINICFTGVTFFNLPATWRDSEVDVTNLLTISSFAYFNTLHPHFNCNGKTIIGIEILLNIYGKAKQIPFVYHVVCDFVKVTYYSPSDDNYIPTYMENGLKNDTFPFMKNRV